MFYFNDEITFSLFEPGPNVLHAIAGDAEAIVLLIRRISIRIYAIFLNNNKPSFPIAKNLGLLEYIAIDITIGNGSFLDML